MADEEAFRQEAPGVTVEHVAGELPGFPKEAVQEALDTLANAGVLTREEGDEGEERFRYTNPEKYRLINAPVIRQPGPDFGKL